MIGIGPMEIVILLLGALLCIGVPIALVSVFVVGSRRGGRGPLVSCPQCGSQVPASPNCPDCGAALQ